ncbi:adenylyltransferase/cytidyltransferase family protein [Actinomycetospora sp. C-140]
MGEGRPRRVLTFGTFDLFHVGHLLLLERAAAFGELVVGVSTDDLVLAKKSRRPVFPSHHRVEIVRALRCVSAVFPEEGPGLKRRYLVEHGADVLVMGDDWAGHFDELGDVCEVVYLPRTPSISTTATIEAIATTVEVPDELGAATDARGDRAPAA